jgi:large subunit ribosomal protein L9
MEVILREDVAGLGIIGDVVRVKPGYARNYLLPRGLAVPADRRNLGQLEHHKRIIEAKKKRERGSIEAIARNLEGLRVEIEARAGRGGKLFGSVTNMDVQRLLGEKDFDIDRRRIQIKEPIKHIGDFEVVVRVGQDVAATITVGVKPQGGELEDVSVDGEQEQVRAVSPEPAVAEVPEGDASAQSEAPSGESTGDDESSEDDKSQS